MEKKKGAYLSILAKFSRLTKRDISSSSSVDEDVLFNVEDCDVVIPEEDVAEDCAATAASADTAVILIRRELASD